MYIWLSTAITIRTVHILNLLIADTVSLWRLFHHPSPNFYYKAQDFGCKIDGPKRKKLSVKLLLFSPRLIMFQGGELPANQFPNMTF